MISVRVDSAHGRSFGIQSCTRSGERCQPQAFLIELDLEDACPFANRFSPEPQSDEPRLASHSFQVAGRLSGDDLMTVVGMLEKPGAADEFALHREGQRRIEHHQDQRVPNVVGQLLVGREPTYLGGELWVGGALVEPGRDRAAKHKVACFVPILGFRRSQRECADARMATAREGYGTSFGFPDIGVGRCLDWFAGEPRADLRPTPSL
jgi:hypothetical protein